MLPLYQEIKLLPFLWPAKGWVRKMAYVQN